MDSPPLGYCCNVHPGKTFEEVRQSLLEFAVTVKNLIACDLPLDSGLGVGLWLSATTAQQLSDSKLRMGFRDWLQEAGLIPYTLNGFPYGDFHQKVVKHQVYQPTWADESRLEYTLQLSSILHDLLPNGTRGTISTLPLGWPQSKGSEDRSFFQLCARNLQRLVNRLVEFKSRTGREIVVCIEPEPGCILDSAEDLVRFFEDHLSDHDGVREHLGVCHDVCHSAVMFEGQAQAIDAYRKAGILVGKVQVSSAVSLNFDFLSDADREFALAQIEEFSEPRYLHQTVWKCGGQTNFFEDLPLAISEIRKSDRKQEMGELRVHFHVPIFADQLGLLSTTQPEIGKCIEAIRANLSSDPLPHFEVETYAWNVLPEAFRPNSLAQGIAQELGWLQKQLGE